MTRVSLWNKLVFWNKQGQLEKITEVPLERQDHARTMRPSASAKKKLHRSISKDALGYLERDACCGCHCLCPCAAQSDSRASLVAWPRQQPRSWLTTTIQTGRTTFGRHPGWCSTKITTAGPWGQGKGSTPTLGIPPAAPC